MSSSSSSRREYVFIEVDATQQRNTPNYPPEDLKIEFPPVFNEEELGSKILRNCNNTTRVPSNRRKPPNAFILFRKKYLDALHRRGQRYPMKNVSGWARDAWKSLDKHQKQEYESIATRAASLYHEWASSVPNKKRQNKNPRRKKIITDNSINTPTPLSSANSSAINSPTSPLSSNNFPLENLHSNTVHNNIYSASYFPSPPSNDFTYQFPGLSSNEPFDTDEFVSPAMNSQKVDEYSAYLKEDNNIDTIIDNNDANANYMASDNGTNGINFFFESTHLNFPYIDAFNNNYCCFEFPNVLVEDLSNQNSYLQWMIAQQSE
ncbi:19551_t:CDS:2 [Entrophospora sp. SA101]|nr:2660_t:CDS:2 [Entrophospora sp. SA101]CAJ0629933.1 4110_t:CDS:2 [Entrophospora sp. SA101]CAJ0751754.1 19551_t:CDS:2 [Entrophospora sp. SA101]CAJ0826632.1 21603_t:CDS:2 [Entrophospora sp. SA101]CAJ0830279.1 8516_t:CDS:2 [Entrophospora sp. SA101]